MPAPRGRWGSFRTWELVVIAIAVVLFILAAFAGPRRGNAPPSAIAPTVGASPSAEATALPTPAASASAAPITPTDAPTGSPVATVDQILADEVGDYVLADRSISETGVDSGAVESVELRYVMEPPKNNTDIFHAIEIHADGEAASERVKTFGAALEQSGYRKLREQSLRNEDGSTQGYFISLRGAGQPLLLWSNRNATFSLGGGVDADVNGFYEALPY